MTKGLLAALLLSAASLLGAEAQAQGRFRPGYVVRLSGDTLRGQVQQRGTIRAAAACTFRPSATAEPTEYRPAELRAYGFTGGDRYEARVMERLQRKREVVLRTLFLSVLVQGKAQLYGFRDKDDLNHLYLATSPDSVVELKQVRAAVPSTNQDQIVYEDQYPFREVLAEAFRDCPAVQHLLPGLVLSEGDLRRVITRYNACVAGHAAPAPATPTRQRSKASFGVVGGLQNDRADFESSSNFSSGEFKGSARPFGGIFVVLNTPALNHHLSLRLDALYERLHYQSKYVYGKNTETPTTQEVTLDLNYLRLPLQARYSFLRRRVTPYLMVGISYNYLVAYQAPTHTEFTVVNVVYPSDRPALNDSNVSRSDFGLLGGIGVTAAVLGGRALGLEVQAQRSSGFVSRASMVTRLGAMLSLTLIKKPLPAWLAAYLCATQPFALAGLFFGTMRLTRSLPASLLVLALAAACQRGPLTATAHLPSTATSQPVGRDIAPDAGADAIIKPYHDKVLAQMQEVLGVAPMALSKNPGENLVVNFVADLQRTAAAQALHQPIALGVMTNGGMRSPIPAGPITLGNIFELMPFENELVVVDAPGPVVQQLFNYAAPVRMAVSGATYSVDADKHPQNILIGGQPFDPTKTYSIAMSDYLAGGGDNMLFLRGVPERSTGLLLRSAIADHIRALTKAGKPVTASIEGRVR